ncbi:MAG: CpsD/CapB family tyrosine-protein kinase, partial [Eubacteriales bacterium]|nr:CpsD/CapB family tyrosine-protein kinase [Eubacteriales bacterium]
MNKIDLEFQELPYAVEEAMNRLRINIKFCGKNTKKILITSSLPCEGKSTISSNLWKMLAEAGFSTVLVDADLRKSELKRRLKMGGGEDFKGLDYYLSGLAEYEDVVYETNIKNAYLVPVTNHLENPSALLEDARFRELLDRLAQEHRYVIIDSAPLGSVADGALVASMCDGAALVIRCKETPRGLIRQSFQQLEQVNCKVLGAILNHSEDGIRAYGK